MKKFLAQFMNNVRGATAIEYALIAGLIAIAIIAGATLVGNQIGTSFNEIASNL